MILFYNKFVSKTVQTSSIDDNSSTVVENILLITLYNLIICIFYLMYTVSLMKKVLTLGITIIMSIFATGFLSNLSISASSLDTSLLNKVFAQEPEPEPEQVFIAPGSSDQNNEDGGFVPSETSVSTSEGNNIVLWTNDDTIEHTVTADDGSFDSGPISPGDNFDSTFDTHGDFSYHCSIHPFMTGVVIVE
jgi:plastocyanin